MLWGVSSGVKKRIMGGGESRQLAARRYLINDNYFGRSWEAEIGRFVDGARGV